jgi:hypothetical protein
MTKNKIRKLFNIHLTIDMALVLASVFLAASFPSSAGFIAVIDIVLVVVFALLAN